MMIAVFTSNYYYTSGAIFTAVISVLLGLIFSFYCVCMMGSYFNFGNATGVQGQAEDLNPNQQ